MRERTNSHAFRLSDSELRDILPDHSVHTVVIVSETSFEEDDQFDTSECIRNAINFKKGHALSIDSMDESEKLSPSLPMWPPYSGVPFPDEEPAEHSSRAASEHYSDTKPLELTLKTPECISQTLTYRSLDTFFEALEGLERISITPLEEDLQDKKIRHVDPTQNLDTLLGDLHDDLLKET